MAGENFGEFGESGALCQSFTHLNLATYITKPQVNKKFTVTNEYPANT